MEDLRKRLGEGIRNRRKALDLNQQQVAEKADEMPLRTYGDIERGDAWPEYASLLRIAKALECEPVELFSPPSPAAPRPTISQAFEVLREALIEKNVEVLQRRGFAAAPTPDLESALRALPVPEELRDLLAVQAEAWLEEHREPASGHAPASRKSRKPSG